jgi:subfamily B ATP-binding cassette protein MsbA
MKSPKNAASPGAGPGAPSKDGKKDKRPLSWSNAWREARTLIIRHRQRLMLGLVLILINSLAAMVMPSISSFLLDDIVAKPAVSHPDGAGWAAEAPASGNAADGADAASLPGRLTHLKSDLLQTLLNRDPNDPSAELFRLALIAGIAVLVQAATSFALSQTLSIAAQRAVSDMRQEVQAHVTRLPVRWFDTVQSGQLISRIMTDAEGVRNLIGTGLVQLVGGIITATLAVTVLFFLNWRLTIATIIVLVIFAGICAVAFSRLRPLFRDRGRINAEVTGRLGESLSGIRVVKAYVAEERERQVFGDGIARLFANVRASITGVSAMTAATTVVVGVVAVAMIIIGGHSLIAGTMTHGQLFQYLIFTGLVAAPVVQMASIGTQITEAFAGLDRIRELRQVVTEDAGDEARATLATLNGEVAFDHVTFAYTPGQPVLHDISFHAPAGSTTALVGSSGSGKSTLASLVMAFNRPDEGKVLIDGKDLAGIRLAAYRSHLGVVLQDNFLFDGTIAENIRFSRPEATDAEVAAAGAVARCDEFVDGFPDKYATVVGERGVRLSGGQRQRLAIARAVLAKPSILILDEATSNLDSESEAFVQEGLRALRQGRTTFVIAHRLSTIRSADQILVLEGGRIVERGTHDQLFAANGRYRQLHDRQHQVQNDRYINPGEVMTLGIPKAAEKMPAHAGGR